jgi:crotonobetainyl-CoA:carnitine CoA-transferase CaiB-like acyl-CoA transferase
MGSYQAGLTAAVGILAAVYARRTGAPGQAVDASGQEAQLAIGYIPIQRLESEGVVEDRFARFFRVEGVMPAQDGYIELLTLEPRQWEGLIEFLGRPDWATPQKFRDPATYGGKLNRHLRDWFSQHTKAWLYHQGQAHGVPVAPYDTPAEVFESPQQRARGFFIAIDHPEAGRYDYAGLPFRFSETPPVELRHGMDHTSGMMAAFCAVAALCARSLHAATGSEGHPVGQHVDVSVRDIATAFLGPALLDSAMNRRENCRQGNRDEAMAPHGVYRCHGENAWVSIAVGSDKSTALPAALHVVPSGPVAGPRGR